MPNLIFVLLSGLFFLVSCGDDAATEAIQAETQKVTDGRYRAVLSPLNAELVGSASGETIVTIDGDQFVVETSVAGLGGGSRHFQAMHTGARCPGPEADLNGDGLVDVSEGSRVFGQILLPFDSDLNTQIDGSEFSPLSNRAGSYFFRGAGLLDRVLADLRDVDPEASDMVTKLSTHEGLDLSRRTIVIYGASRNRDLPPTTAALGNLSPSASVPVACGQLELVDADAVHAEGSEEENVSGVEAYRIEDEEGVDYGT